MIKRIQNKVTTENNMTIREIENKLPISCAQLKMIRLTITKISGVETILNWTIV